MTPPTSGTHRIGRPPGARIVGTTESGERTHTGPAFADLPIGSLPAGSGKRRQFTGTTVIKVVDGMIAEEAGLDDGVTVLQQLGLLALLPWARRRGQMPGYTMRLTKLRPHVR